MLANSPGQQQHGRSVMIGGVVLSGKPLVEYAEKHGLCSNCAETVVRRKVNIWSRWEPVTEMIPGTNEYRVYKGFCIQPTCYTLEQAKSQLGEAVESRRRQRSYQAPGATPSPDLIRSRRETIIRSPSSGGKTGRRLHSPARVSFSNQGDQNRRAELINTTLPSMPTLTRGAMSERSPTRSRFGEQQDYNYSSSAKCFRYESGALHQRNTEIDREIEENSHIKSLQEYADKGDFGSFMLEMDLHHFTKDVAKRGFKILREAVMEIHKTKPDTYLFTSDSWAKTIKTALVAAKNSETVVEGLLVFMSFSGASPAYRRDVLQYVDSILTVRDKFDSDRGIEDLCCACLEVLFADNQDREWRLKSVDAEKFIKVLITIMNTREGNDRCDFALRALFNLSLQEHFSVNGISVADRINEALTTNNGVDVMISTLKGAELTDMVTEAALYLLWRLSLPTANPDGVTFQPGSGIQPTENIVQIVLDTMKMHETSPLTQEAGCGILCNLMLPSSTQQYPLFLAKTTVDTITGGLSRHRDLPNHWDSKTPSNVPDVKMLQMVHLNGILAIHNLLCNNNLRNAVGPDAGVLSTSVVASMRLFKEKPVIQAVGCMALSRICGMGAQPKRELVSAGGILVVADAFRRHVKDASSEEKNARSIFDGACTIAASLSILPETRSDLLHSDLVTAIQEIFMRDPNVASGPSAQFVLTNAVTMTHDSNPEVLLNHIMKGSSNIEMAEACFSAIASAALQSNDYLNKLLLCHRGHGTECLIDLMERFTHSAVVQQEGIAILGLLYFTFPFTGVLGNITRIDEMSIKSHTVREVDVIRNAMRLHRPHSGVQENGFLALSNFIAPICSETSGVNQSLSFFASSLKDIEEALVLNENAASVYRSAIHFFRILTFIVRDDDLQVWGLRILPKLFDRMRQYPTDDELKRVGCEAILRLLNDERRLEFVSSIEQFETIFHCINLSNDDVVAHSCEIVATLLSNYFPASNHIVEIDNAVEQLIFCMSTFVDSEEIQLHLCSITKSLVTLQDHDVKHMIAECGGLISIMNSAMRHRRNQVLVEDAVLAMTGVARALTSGIITSMKTQLGDFVVCVIEDNMDNPDLEAAILGLLWVLCGHDDYFKTLVSESNTIPQIIDVMNQHLPASELQKAGCSILWVLSSFGDNKLTIGRVGGIRTIVNAMNAHTENTALQKEALTAIKNLATAHENNHPLIQNGAEDAVIRVLWINMMFPQVLSAGFSALNNIAVDSRNRSVALMQEVTLKLIMQAMRRFPANEHVQKNAVFLLKSYSYFDENLQLMASHADDLVLLLAMAMDSFPEECSERARYLMRKVEQTAVDAMIGSRR